MRENKVEILEDFRECTGCGACDNICPTDAITMSEGYQTFFYPYIDNDKCIECYRCQQVCPVNSYENKNKLQPKIIAASADDEICSKSSSGGCFTVFSENVIKKGGTVFATAFDENLDACFMKVEDLDGLEKCRGSKYVQSSAGKIFREVKNELKRNKEVIFFGCPCQVAGLNKYLEGDYPNLHTVDILCHGVPSGKLFHQYLGEKKGDGIIQSVDFRNKDHGWRADVIQINFKNKSPYIRSWRTEDEFETAFQENLCLRESCESCEFCDFPRVGDISIGDFWGISKLINIDVSKGISLVMLNNEKGEKFFDQLKESFAFLEEMDISTKDIDNRIHKIYPHHPNKELFFGLLNHHTFCDAVKMAVKGMYDIGIVGIPTVENFGGSLTYVALYNVIKEWGYTCVMIERPKNSIHPPTPVSRIYHSSPFGKNELLDNIEKREDMSSLTDRAKKFLVGSDQLFHANLMRNFSGVVLLDWVSDNIPKLAYAASFGHDQFTGNEDLRAEMAYYMQKFDAFSVREESGIKLAKEEFGVSAVHVLDPVFLCSDQVYMNMISQAKKEYSGKEYIGAYILDPNEKKEKALLELSKEMNLPLIIYSEFFYDNTTIKKRWNLDIETGKIEDRLSCIYNSKFFVTDSFHGMCFSVIFRKQFIAVKNEGRGAARFTSLMEKTGLSGHLVSETEDLKPESDIDYTEVYDLLKNEIQQSKLWLKQQLEKQYRKPFSGEDVIRKKLEKENLLLKEQIRKIKDYLRIDYTYSTSFSEYLDMLMELKERLLIIVAAKDTPGMAIPEAVLLKMKKLGFEVELTRKKHWSGYVAVLSRGKSLYESCKYQEVVEYKTNYEGVDIAVTSAPLYKGNTAEIIINGRQYSVQSRGLNFAVYDLEQRRVSDSVGFDTHHYLMKSTRDIFIP